MISFLYQVKDEMGRNLYGVVDAKNKKEVKKKISGYDYYFVSAKPCNKNRLFKRSVKFQEVLMFTHRMTSLMEAGIPILAAMNILWRQSEDKTIQIVISQIRTRLEEGSDMSTSLDSFPRIFPSVYRALIRVGEKSGALVHVLNRLSEYLEYKAQMVARIKKVTMYPVVVIIFAVIIVLFLFSFVVPRFEKVLLRMDVELPWLTKVILDISSNIQKPGFILGSMVGLATFVVSFIYLKKMESVAYWLDKMMLKIPYFGHILTVLSLSQLVRSLTILLGAGVPVLESIDVANTTTNNRKLISDLNKVKTDIEEGNSLYQSFKKIRDFPVLLTEMIGIGESSGMMVKILEKVTKHFDDEVDMEMNKFLTLLEPALILVVGGIVILTLLAIYLPIMTIWQEMMNS